VLLAIHSQLALEALECEFFNVGMFARRMLGLRMKYYLNNEAIYVGERLAA
jgi:hypothetical protein